MELCKYMHLVLPVNDRKEDMVYYDWGKFWCSKSLYQYGYKIEYVYFEKDTIFPEILSKQCYIAYKVEDMKGYLEEADEILFGPYAIPGNASMCIIRKGEAIIELYKEESGGGNDEK